MKSTKKLVTIYKITNLINNKIYIGQTTQSLKRRLKHHKHRALAEKYNLPLYDDIRKYGIKNFKIEKLETTDYNNRLERETYWILYYNAHKIGYNTRMSLSPKTIQDINTIIDLYKNEYSPEEIHKITRIRIKDIKRVLLKYTDYKPTPGTAQFTKKSILIKDIKTNKLIHTANTYIEAAKYIKSTLNLPYKIPTIRRQVSYVCKGLQSSAYGCIFIVTNMPQKEKDFYHNRSKQPYIIYMKNKETNKTLKTFTDKESIVRFLRKHKHVKSKTASIYSNINNALLHNNKTAYGYKWQIKYVNS